MTDRGAYLEQVHGGISLSRGKKSKNQDATNKTKHSGFSK